jgi:hypothetical protein
MRLPLWLGRTALAVGAALIIASALNDTGWISFGGAVPFWFQAVAIAKEKCVAVEPRLKTGAYSMSRLHGSVWTVNFVIPNEYVAADVSVDARTARTTDCHLSSFRF